ncbi:hypothetical protein SAMN02910340_02136 [Methanosarcina thermophila]|jgi:hypothetical protein|uniref:Uncharacterized protein n=3 Tax=Methanosarcina thermophila TaxID=2210 RepID=A0A1I7AIA8_METTE|nr:hypothetical protein [Methanosarcina thermophila]ALK06007.1 MAG: hypothetical protein AAY43_10290 [Methanosarcina sp. 795]AKB12410.1 hypothetical protein MSTHT_0652 [Methanosarcina thermophila TM-1]AKB14386.1 hypothetical protein MSTHC_0068 [Methanosarcina thermophila CHTI-55]NLU58061.1 hypothetical protein [Methanosarcina thermophila]SFT74691.1 hypothetical protein SAMN02910340_02136 [Methanosarcina thermophila]
MENPNFEISAINEKINRLEKTQVIKNYYLVLGGGKIGTDFLHYARKNKFPFVLVIDKDENAPASDEADIKTEAEVVNLLKNKASEPSPNKVLKSPRVAGAVKREDEGENEKEDGKPEIYFCKMDLKHIPFLLSYGIPEYIIPAVPCHAVAYMLSELLKFPLEPAKNESLEKIEDKSQKGSSPVTELIIGPENKRLMTFFEKLAASFPADVIAGRYPEHGMLFFSYAREGEICPDGCPGPRDRCPTFGRIKPETITEYAGKLRQSLPGWVFESHQMKPGTGGLKGKEFKQNLLEIFEFVRAFKENKSGERLENPEDRAFFIATTCTCHGVLNLFYVL